MPLVVLHTQYMKRRLSGSAARGQATVFDWDQGQSPDFLGQIELWSARGVMRQKLIANNCVDP